MKLYQQQQTEAMFLATVTDYAQLRGWEFMHIQPGLTERGRYRTPVQGTLGPGWPDLILVRGSSLIAVELKTDREDYPSAIQRRVLNVLEQAVIEVHVWRPTRLGPDTGAAAMRETMHRPLILPEGVQVLPATYWGLRGLPRGPQGGFWSPVGVAWKTGTPIKAWYCHYYRTADEHWHVNEEDQHACRKQRGDPDLYA